MKKKIISIITVSILALTVFVVPSYGAEGDTWSSWVTSLPSGVTNYETKTQYRYRDKSFVTNGYYNYSGYTRSASKLVSTTYGDWKTSKTTTSDKEGATYRTIVSNESKGSVYYAYAYVCNCKKWFWKNSGGCHNGSCTTKNLFKIYSSKSISQYSYDTKDNDGSYILPQKIGKTYPGKLGTVYLSTYNGNSTNYFKSAASNTYMWKNGTKTIYRPVTKKYQYTHWKWGSWSAYSDSQVSATANREVQSRTVYRYKLENQTINAPNTINKKYGNAPFSIGASAKTSLTYSSSNTAVATVSSNGTVKIHKAGTANITVKASESTRYSSATKIVTINVAKASQSIKCDVGSTVKKTFSSKSFSLGANAKTGLTYTTSNKKVATVSSEGKVYLKNPGKAVITIKAREGSNYKSATKTVDLSVFLKKPTLSVKTYKANGKRKAKFTWAKTYGAHGYELYAYVPSSNMGDTKLIKSGDKTAATLSGFKKNIEYKYKIRAYRIVNDEKVYSSYSSYKKVYFSK